MLNRAVTRNAVSSEHASAPAANPDTNSKAELLQAQAVDCDVVGVPAAPSVSDRVCDVSMSAPLLCLAKQDVVLLLPDLQLIRLVRYVSR